MARLGVDPEPVVLLCDQGIASLVATLAVLKAGKFYVPLDPLDDPDRITAILETLESRVIISDRLNLDRSSTFASHGRTVLEIESLGEGHSKANPTSDAGPDSLAYIHFTSGTTGSPKGVMDTHRNVLHNILRYTNSLKISSKDRLSLLHLPNYSACVSSMFSALLNGACCCPLNLRELGLVKLPTWVVETGITIYHSTPLIFREAVNQTSRTSALRIIRLEGEKAEETDVTLFKEFCPKDSLLVNGLGTTETGLCRQFFIDRNTQLRDGIVPLGYAVTDMEILLIDDNNSEVSPGTMGRIAGRSKYLFPEYWKQSKMTRAAFLPRSQKQIDRILKTGDLGRLRADGCLEYLGRTLPNIIHEKPIRCIRSGTTEENPASASRKPRTSMEKLLGDIWSEVLMVPDIDRLDGFFNLGGDSLIAMRVIARLKQISSMNVNVRDILDHPILADLANFLDRPDASQEESKGISSS